MHERPFLPCSRKINQCSWRLKLREGKSMVSNVTSTITGTKMTALVVDDDRTNRSIHHGLLENLGIKTQAVMNGKEAVDIFCSGQDFDLILMDMDMPVMNGIEATKKLRDMGISSIIAGVSTQSEKRKIRAFMEAGLDGYQEKPLTRAKLVSVLHKISNSR